MRVSQHAGVLAAVSIVLAALVAGCGGGAKSTIPTPAVPSSAPTTVPSAGASSGASPGASPSASPTPSPSPSPSPSPTLPASISQTIAVGGSPVTASLGTVAGGTTAAVTIPGATSGSGTVTALLGTALPGLAPALSSVQRGPAKIGVTPLTAVTYVTLTATANLTLPRLPAFTFTLSGGAQQTLAAQSYIALYDASKPSVGWTTADGPGVVNGSTVSFTGGSVPFTFTAGQIYVFAYFTTSQTPTIPSAAPSASPSPAPTSTTQVVTVAATPASVPLGAISTGISGSMTIPAISSGSGTFTLLLDSKAPTLAPVLAAVGRLPATIGVKPLTGLAYVTMTSTTNVSLPSYPGFVFSFAAGAPAALTGQAYMALFDPSKPLAGWNMVDGPGIINGGTVTFTGGPGSFAMTAGQLYAFSFFTVPSVLTLNYNVLVNGAATPTSVTIPNGTSTTVMVTATAGVNNPTFSWSSSTCGTLVTTPASGLGPMFTLTSPGTTTGSCTFSVSAGTGVAPATVNVTVN